MGEGGKTTSRRGRVNVAKWGSKTTSQKVKRRRHCIYCVIPGSDPESINVYFELC